MSITSKELADFINANLNCFAIENQQGRPGPEYIAPVEVMPQDVVAEDYTTAVCRDDKIATLNRAVEQAFLDRGDHEGLTVDWLNTCSGDSCGLGELPGDEESDEESDE